MFVIGSGFTSFHSRYETRFVGPPYLVSGIKFVGQREYFIFSYDIVMYVSMSSMKRNDI